MREFQERRRLKKFLHSRYAIGILIVVLILLAHSVWSVYQKYEKSKEISSRMKADLASLQAREDSLKQSIDSLATPEGKEREMRDRFGVVKEGEKMVILVNDAPTGTDASITPETGWWAHFWGLFGL